MGDGNGWGRCANGHMHWGRHGAAGLLAFHTDQAGDHHVLLQRRALWGSGGGTWGLFGGGRHRDEDPIRAALRETSEECTLDLTKARIIGFSTDDHGGWDFTTVVAHVPTLQDVRPKSAESMDAAWVPADAVEQRRLFDPFAANWPLVRRAMSRVVVVVDVANVMGSRPDGWWRDRAGAAVRLRDQLAPLAAGGVCELPDGLFPFDRCYPELVLVVEGAARGLDAGEPGVRVVAAAGSGDDAIVDLVGASEPGVRHLVVTADRELRARCQAAGAAVTSPRWLLDQIS